MSYMLLKPAALLLCIEPWDGVGPDQVMFDKLVNGRWQATLQWKEKISVNSAWFETPENI